MTLLFECGLLVGLYGYVVFGVVSSARCGVVIVSVEGKKGKLEIFHHQSRAAACGANRRRQVATGVHFRRQHHHSLVKSST
jgi:predicted secreted protein